MARSGTLFGDPVCGQPRQALLSAARAEGATVHDGGTYVCMEGPAFSTRAESELYRSWGAKVIGMTNLPEAKLAREAGMSYATLAMSTDYDCWHDGHDDVTVEQVIAVLQANVALARRVVRGSPESPLGAVSPFDNTLASAMISDRPHVVRAAARAGTFAAQTLAEVSASMRPHRSSRAA